jgi:hypothetical protein
VKRRLIRAGAFLKEHRRRIARIVAVVAIGAMAGHLAGSMPREVDIRYDLGPNHQDLTEVAIRYELDGEEMGGIVYRYERGAPAAVVHTVELQPGDYRVVAEMTYLHGRRTVRRALTVPADGVVRIDLFDTAVARFG